jgi:hypothetical protein
VNLYEPYKEKLMKTKTVFTTAAILFAFSTGSALAVDPETLINNLPNVTQYGHNAKLYCKIDTHEKFEAFKEKNAQKGFDYLEVYKREPEKEGIFDYYWITHKNSVFLVSQVLDYMSLGQQLGKRQCRIFSEDISDYKSKCQVRGTAALDYAIGLYADEQHRVESNWQNLIKNKVVSEGGTRYRLTENQKKLFSTGNENYVDSKYLLVRSQYLASELRIYLFSKEEGDDKFGPDKDGFLYCSTISKIEEK